MSSRSVPQKANITSFSIYYQVLAAAAGGAVLFVFFMLLLATFFDASHAGRIFPGVFVGGVDVSGLSPEQAALLLTQKLTFPQEGKIVLKDGDKVWIAQPAELGLSVDAKANAEAAYLYGRRGNSLGSMFAKLAAWYSGKNLSPLLVYDESAAQSYLLGIANQVDRPAKDASFGLNGINVVAVPGQIGRTVDLPATLAALNTQIRTLTDGIVPLVLHETTPEVMDASQQADAARKILSAPLTLQIPDAKPGGSGTWVIPQDQLAKMLTVGRVQATDVISYQVGLNQDALKTYLNALAPDIDQQSSNARFTFNDDTRKLDVIQPSVSGRSLDVKATLQDINQKIAQGQHSVPLKMVYNQPEVTEKATGEQLGISELVVSYTSYFRGSSAERMQNIKTAAANFHGLLVAPGATFSMASAMGEVSLDTGYAEALIIYGDRTIKGVGGGVCQVSTTLFRTAFLAGFPIVERHPHAYRVGYYEQNATGYDDKWAGLDATVFVPVVDFKFQNDTPYWLLMETYFNPARQSLTWKFYSTKDGRTVEWDTSGPQNVVDPPDPVYEENPDLAKGQIKQVDWSAEGADITVTRTVYRDGQAIFTDSISTHYLPWGDIFQYGPGTHLPNTKNPKKNPLINP